MTREEAFHRLLRSIAKRRKRIEKILRRHLGRKGDRRSLTALAVLNPSSLQLDDLPFPENVRPILREDEFQTVSSLWADIQREIETVFRDYDDILESYRRQVLSHYYKKLCVLGNVIVVDEQREDLYMCLNLGIVKGLLCYDPKKGTDDPAKFFLKVIRGIFRSHLSTELFGVHIPPTQYQKIIANQAEIPIVTSLSQFVNEEETSVDEEEDKDNLISLSVPVGKDPFLEMEVRDVMERLLPPFRSALQAYLEGSPSEEYPMDVGSILVAVALLTVYTLLEE